MNENQLFSSFMMLNQHLYEIFAHYIINGRSRAPPETELIEMLPTFQFGARTDRRALQSKFKSWAKRMNFENGCLTLASAGKIIIPKEKCDDLVMFMHSPEHHDIEKVIAQIRMNYSWTRKNFGMDRDVVVQSIMRNCKRAMCVKRMRMEIAKLSNSLCSGSENFPAPEFIPDMLFGMPPPLPCFPPYHYPLAFPIPPMFSPNGIPFQIPIFNNICNLGHPVIRGNETNGLSMTEKNDFHSSGVIPDVESKTNDNSFAPNAKTSSDSMTNPNKMSPIKFKKPKTLHEYKSLMEAVRSKPNDFPGILKDEKTQFLALLGIAPKIVCSSRTLKNFRAELKHKQFMNRGCVIYRERKMLRDRNKLNKCLLQKKTHNYLGILAHKDLSPKFLEKEKASSKRSDYLKASKRLNCERKDTFSNAKRMKISHCRRRFPIEVITIDSSDEETSKNVPSPLEIAEDDEKNETNSKRRKGKTISGDELTDTTAEQSSNVDRNDEHFGENNKHGDRLKTNVSSERFLTDIEQIKTEPSSDTERGIDNFSEDNKHDDYLGKEVGSDIFSTEVGETESLDKTTQPPSTVESDAEYSGENKKHGYGLRTNVGSEKSSIKVGRTKFIFLQNFCDSVSNKKRLILPKLLYKSALKTPSDSNILVRESHLPVPQLVQPSAKDSTRYLYQKINPVPVAIRRATPSFSQSKATFETRNPNGVTKLIYPVPVTKASGNSRVLLLDKDQKGSLYIVPQHNKPILQQNFSRSHPQATLDSEIAKTQLSVQSLASQIHELKAKNAKAERAINKKLVRKEEMKVDINEEMRRVTAWIYRMKANVNPGMFSCESEKSVQKLLSQLEIGIHLVREAKKSLMEIESYVDGPAL